MTDDRGREELGSEVGMLPPTRREYGKKRIEHGA